MRRAVTMIMAAVMLLTMALTFAFTSSGEGTAEFLTAVVANGAASLPAEAEGVDEIGILYIPADATDITGVFTEGKTISSLILKGNAYDAASIQAVKDAAPITVYYNRLTAGGGTGEALADASGVTLINLLGSRSEIINSEESNKATVVGTIAADDVDYDDLYVTAVFKKPGMADKTLRQQIKNVYTTVRGAATTYASTAASQGLMYIEDAKYLFGLTVNGIPTGCYDVKVTVDAVVNGQAVTSGETNSFSVVIPDHEHELTESVVAPQGEARGYTQKVCSICGYTEKYGPYDYSLYSGVDFENNGKFLIPYAFDCREYTIEATVNVPTDYAGRPGVIVGNYGAGAGFNFEIYTNGQPRLYMAIQTGNRLTGYNYFFNYDARKGEPVNLALTFKRGEATLYADGEFVETLALGDFAIPQIGRTLVMGGDCRSGNSAAFKGTIYSVSIFRDYRAPEEIREDLILADSSDANCCVSYNLLDASVLGGGVELSELEYAQAHDAEELAYYASVGVKEIEVMNDIVLDRTVYVVADVTIYANGDYTIRRDPGFAGDMFVIGENSVGRNLILEGFTCQLTFGKEGANGSLTVDGNKENTTVDVYGTLVYVNNSGVFNMTDQITLTNNKKVGNSRTLGSDLWYGNSAGGAAILNVNGVINMNGGVISACEVNMTDPSNGDSTAENYLQATHGGAIFNASNFYMNGGSISGCQGYYGGAMCNVLNAQITSGVIEDCTSTYAGGAIYNFNDYLTQLAIGKTGNPANSVIIRRNTTNGASGGAVFAGYRCNVIVTDGVTFDGNHAAYYGGALNIGGCGSVEGANILFTGNSADYAGGAIYAVYSRGSGTAALERRTVTITGVTFENNTCVRSGGAISAVGADVTVTDCTFDGNTAASGGAAYANYNDKAAALKIYTSTIENCAGSSTGGAIHADNAVVTFRNGSVSECTSAYGGAAYLTGGATLTVNGTTFADCSSTAGGGGAFYLEANCQATLTGVSITGSSAATNGGAFYTKSPVTLTNCTVSGSAGSYGGAFNVNGAVTITLTRGSVSSNTAAAGGGAFYLTGGASLAVNGTTFDGNSATGNGGAIYYENGCTGSFTNAVFTNNSATGSGGAIVSKSPITLTNCTVTGNSAQWGGAFNMNGSAAVLTLDGGSVSSNTASASGGAVYLKNASSINASGVIFDNDKVTGGSGGVIYEETGAAAALTNCTVTNASASANGGVLYLEGSATATVDGTDISDASAGTGGAFYLKGTSSLTVTDGSVSACSSAYGGAAYVTGNAALTVNGQTGTTFDGCSSTAGGGGTLYFEPGCSGSIENATIENSTSAGSGGGIYTKSPLTLTNCTVRNNSGSFGGGVYAANGYLTVSGGEISGNTARSGYGGGLSTNTSGTYTLTDVTFDGNTGNYGAGLCVGTGTTVNASGCSFTNNASTGVGGAIYTSGSAQITLTNGSVSSNTATTSGAAAQVEGSSHFTANGTTFTGNGIFAKANAVVSLTDCRVENVTVSGGTGSAFHFEGAAALSLTRGTVSGCSAAYGGAGYFTGTSSLTADGTVFDGNNATSSGGALYFEAGCTGTFTNASFTNNTAASSGGAVNMASSLTMTGCTVTGNSAQWGGAFNVNGSTVTLTLSGGSVSNNTASSQGGAVYLKNASKVNANGTAFNSDKATSGEGGAIFCTTGSTAHLTNCSVSGCTAATKGGALYLEGSAQATADGTPGTAISGCSAQAGGAIYAKGTSTVSLTNGSVNNCAATAGGNGGAVAIFDTAALTVDGTTFDGNRTVDSAGGTIYLASGTTGTIENATVENGYSGSSGGGVYARGALTLTNSTVSNCSGTYGGGVNLGGANCTVSSCTIVGNTARSGYGGGLSTNSSGTYTFTNVTFDGNVGNYGAGLCVGSGTTVNASGCDITNNTSSGVGGGVYTSGSAQITLTGGTVSGNKASTSGSGAQVEGSSHFTADGTAFTGNGLSGSQGGAIYAKATAAVILNDCAFENNAGSYGGALFLTGTPTLSVTGGSFRNNTSANTGGAIYSDAATGNSFSFDSVTFEGNASTGNGGACCFSGAVNATFTDVTFRNNDATGSAAHGDAVYQTSYSKVTVVSASFDQNGGEPLYLMNANSRLTITAAGVTDVNHTPVDFDLLVYAYTAQIKNDCVSYV